MAGKEEPPCQGIEGGIEEEITLLPIGHKPAGRLLKDHRPDNILRKDHRGGIENLMDMSNEHSVQDIIQTNLEVGIQGRKKDTINRGKEKIPVCRGVIRDGTQEGIEDNIPPAEIKGHTMMKEGKILMAEEGKERVQIQDMARDINREWTGMQGSQVIGNLVEITAQTAVERC